MSYSFGPGAFVADSVGDLPTQRLFGADADISNMLRFEAALVRAQAAAGLVPAAAASQAADLIEAFAPDLDELRAGFARDGVVPPALVAQLREALPGTLRSVLHLGVTSQDLVDSSGMLACKEAVALGLERLAALDAQLAALGCGASDERVLQARTRMQVALPISVPEKLANWRAPLRAAMTQAPSRFPLQLGGPEGQRRGFAGHHQAVAAHMADALGLANNGRQWHTDRAPVLEVANWYARLAAGLGKLATDVLIMVQTDVREARVIGSGGSSAMPHKANPVLAELIVSQARYCQVQANGLSMAAIHENERSGTSWTLEWLLLPALVVAGNRLVANTCELAGRLRFREAAGQQV